MANRLFFLLLSLALTGNIFAQTTQVTYTESDADFPNPERGFYRYSATYASPYSPLNAATLRSYRNEHQPPSAQYKIYSTLIFRYFFLSDFVNSPITQDFLDKIAQDFATAREAGVKIIVRFAYTEDVNGSGCGNWICPPYGDASKAQMLAHIAQLKPVLQANGDAIAVVQFGFIGVWGEGYYTDYFGDASQPPYLLDAQNWADRGELLTALLDAVPQDRMVQVRYPQIKQRLVYGTDAPTNAAPLAAAEAHDGSLKSRIGHHNDCFLASFTDFGTYDDYGPATPGSDTAALKPYLAADSRFTAVGGETCSGYNPHDDCESAGGKADAEMRRFHYSYLNSQYNNPDVNNAWVSQGCIGDIRRNLGYRFVLLNGDYAQAARPGDAVSVNIDLKNMGYAPPYNPRKVELVLRDAAQQIAYRANLTDADPRFWGSGPHNLQAAPCLPADMPAGNYELLFSLPDPAPSLHDKPDFAIRLANEGVWESATGYNHLLHTVEVKPTAPPAACASSIVFEPIGFVNKTGEAQKALEWKAFPNPTDGALHFYCEATDAQVQRAQLCDGMGRTVWTAFEKAADGTYQMNLAGLAAGVYSLKVETKQGMGVVKVVIQ